MIRITLHGTDTARSCGVEVKGRGMAGPIGPLCRRLIEEAAAMQEMAEDDMAHAMRDRQLGL